MANEDIIEHEKDYSRVFVIRGRDEQAFQEVRRLVESLGLAAIDFDGVLDAHGAPMPYTYDVVTEGLETTGAVVAVFSPDDRAQLIVEDSQEAPRKQARPNVLLETGMALGKQFESTLIVHFLGTDIPSDLLGRHTVQVSFDEEGAIADERRARRDLARRLRAAGCQLPNAVLYELNLTGANGLQLSEPDGNLLENWDFGSGSLEGWSFQTGSGHRGERRFYQLEPVVVRDDAFNPPYCARLSLPDGRTTDGEGYWCCLSQRVQIPAGTFRPVEGRAWSRAAGVEGPEGGAYSLWVDGVYVNEQGVGISRKAPFETGTHPWQERTLVLEPERPLQRVSVNLVFRGPRNHGTVWFDCVSLCYL